MKSIIFNDIKDNVITQFIGVITFGFGVTAFYGLFYNFIETNTIIFGIKDMSFLLLSLLGFILSFNILKQKDELYTKILKTIDFIITLFGFVSMFVPIIILMNTKNINDIIYNSVACLILSVFVFIFKSIGKYLIIKTNGE